VGDGDDVPRVSRLPAVLVAPVAGCIPAGGTVEVVATFLTPDIPDCVPGTYIADAVAALSGSSIPEGDDERPERPLDTVSVRVQGVIGSPQLSIDESEVDLGLTAVSKSVTATIRLRNVTDATTSFTMEQPPWTEVHMPSTSAFKAGRGVTITCSPESGEIRPFGTVDVLLTCQVRAPSACARACVCCLCVTHTCAMCAWSQAADKPTRIRDMVRCSAVGGAPLYIKVRGEVQSPKVFSDSNFLGLGVCFVGVPVTRTVTLTNISNLDAPFTFDNLQDSVLDPNPVALLTSVPRSGVIAPKSSVSVAITMAPQREGKVDALVAYDVEGMLAPIGVALLAEVKGIVVACSMQDPHDKSAPSTSDVGTLMESEAYRCGLRLCRGVRRHRRADVIALRCL
jgi:hypothetical protein